MKPDRSRKKQYAGSSYMADGEKGEAAALSLLQVMYPDYDIQDVRSSQQWQTADVDFLIRLPSEVKRIEVKYDSNLHRGNFCFEYLRVNHYEQWGKALYRGWSDRSEADIFFMWSPQQRYMYSVNHDNLIRGLQSYIANTPAKNLRLGAVPTDEERTTFNIYIPQNFVDHEIYHHDKDTREWTMITP